MKTKGMVICLAAFSLGVAIAVPVMLEFPGWRRLTDQSREIIIARCLQTPNPSERKINGISVDTEGGVIYSDMEVRMVLKGSTNAGHTQLMSQYWPRQDEYYLIFALPNPVGYQAIETYRIIPLGIYFPTNFITAKSLDGQIQEVIRYRLDLIEKETARLIQEKARLQEIIK